VAKVQPETVRPFEEVAGEVKRELAQERAKEGIEAAHDEIEDMRAGARPLADIAKDKNLTLVQVPAVTRDGRDKAGKPVDTLPERDALLAAAFASDVGVDNEALRNRNGGYTWFEVTGIEPARDQTFDEVRAEVERQWREDEIARRLADKARDLVERINKGEAIEALAGEVGAQAKTATELARATAKDDLDKDAVSRIFATPVGKADSAANGTAARAVFKVTAASVSPLVTTTQEAKRIEDQLRDSMADDVIAEYIAQVRKDMNVVVHPEAVRQVVGGEG
jgi:peptidyl-prolyl cis-trans isomerase D